MTQQISMTDVRAIWEELVREQGLRTVQRQLHAVRSVKCCLGYTPQTGTRFVQLDIPASVAKHATTIRRTQAIRLERVLASDEEHVILLLLQEPGLTDVFSLFIDDLLQHLVLTQDAEEAVSTLFSRFEHWQQLFARIASDVIGLERQRGLFGELTILKELLDRHADAPEIWDCWRGPFSANHDFSMSGTALEVKTSIASLPVMHISNEVQLDLIGWQAVVLCLVHLNEVRGGTQTLSGLIHELLERSSARPAINTTFRSKLLKVGVSPQQCDLFTEQGYVVRNIECYQVTEDFPAIRRSALNNAIGKVTYELHPSGCTDHGMDLENALDLFRVT